MSSSCREFDGVIADNETIEKVEECLHLALLYIDRTVEPAVFRYIEPDDSYEIIGWGRDEKGRIHYILRLKDGRVILVSEIELAHIDTLLKVKKKFSP